MYNRHPRSIYLFSDDKSVQFVIRNKILYFIYLILIIIPLGCQKSTTDFSGNWTAKGANFENTLVLNKIPGQKDCYKFSFSGWRYSYDSYTKQNIKFSGNMDEDFFILQIDKGKAFYSDDNRIENKEFPIYNEGEERCKLFFAFNEDTIKVNSSDCHLIYGGYGVTFDGNYSKH